MFQNRLKELRESAGFKSQTEFAKAFGVAQSTVGGWEAGAREPGYETVKKLALFFNVSIDYLLDLTDDRSFSGGPLAEFIKNRRGTTSEEEFAKKCGISTELLRKIENGFRKDGHPSKCANSLSTDDIRAIANGLSVDWRYIACLYDGYNPNKTQNITIPYDDKVGLLSHQLIHNASTQTLTDEELFLFDAYHSLNSAGKKLLLENADVLVRSRKYEERQNAAEERPMIQAAARGGGVTQIEEIRPDELPDDELIP